MKVGIVISQVASETVWNALRFANFALKQGDNVQIFLLGEGVEYQSGSCEKFDIKGQVEEFLKSDKAKIMACGTCLKARGKESTEVCPISTMKDLYLLVAECDKILTF